MQLTNFNTLADAHDYTVNNKRMISNSNMRLFLKSTGLFLIVYDIASGKLDIGGASHSAKETCLLIVKSLEGSSIDDNDFNFIVGDVIGDAVINDTELLRDSLLTDYAQNIDALLSICKGYCNITTNPFSEVTQSQLNAAKGIFTTKQINYNAGQNIVVTVNSELLELVAATVWRVETGFEVENTGRNAHIRTAQKYRIDMSGKKSGHYEIRIPLLNADFNVELG